MSEYIAAWDIAKKRDYTTGFVCRVSPEIVDGSTMTGTPDRVVKYLDILNIDKFNNITYPAMVQNIALRVGHERLVNNCDLIIDGTGVGEAVVDLLRERGLNPMPIVFTGGTQVQEVTADFGQTFGSGFRGVRMVKELHIPKADLVDAGKLVIQQGRVRLAPGLRYAHDFKDQMENFRGKVNEKTNRVKYEAEDEAVHDDMVVCYLMAAWWMIHGHGTDEIEERPIFTKAAETWEPADEW